jgi:hypothetical protein
VKHEARHLWPAAKLFACHSTADLKEVRTIDLEEPTGWVIVPLRAPNSTYAHPFLLPCHASCHVGGGAFAAQQQLPSWPEL